MIIKDCIGFGDGTLIPLAFKPSQKDYTNFNGRKGKYTITMFIICDHRQRICYYHAGWPGNVHNEQVFSNCKVCVEAENHFSTGQYILTDSALTPRDFVNPQYKKAQNQTRLPSNQERFYSICAKPCVAVEHCVGMLKSPFPFLRDIWLRLTQKKKSFCCLQRYIRVAVILHNLMIGYDDDNFDYDLEENKHTSNDVYVALNPNTNMVGPTARQRLQNYLERVDAHSVIVTRNRLMKNKI